MTWPTERILEEVKVLEQQTKNFKLELYRMSWYMRGSLSLDDIYFLSMEEREIIGQLVKENLETTKKSGLPFY